MPKYNFNNIFSDANYDGFILQFEDGLGKYPNELWFLLGFEDNGSKYFHLKALRENLYGRGILGSSVSSIAYSFVLQVHYVYLLLEFSVPDWQKKIRILKEQGFSNGYFRELTKMAEDQMGAITYIINHMIPYLQRYTPQEIVPYTNKEKFDYSSHFEEEFNTFNPEGLLTWERYSLDTIQLKHAKKPGKGYHAPEKPSDKSKQLVIKDHNRPSFFINNFTSKVFHRISLEQQLDFLSSFMYKVITNFTEEDKKDFEVFYEQLSKSSFDSLFNTYNEAHLAKILKLFLKVRKYKTETWETPQTPKSILDEFIENHERAKTAYNKNIMSILNKTRDEAVQHFIEKDNESYDRYTHKPTEKIIELNVNFKYLRLLQELHGDSFSYGSKEHTSGLLQLIIPQTEIIIKLFNEAVNV